MFVGALAQIVPTEVAAAALVIVGTMMFSQLRHVDVSEFSVALPRRVDGRGDAVQLLDRQRHRRRLRDVGRGAIRGG
jgi:hypothetical protein